MYLSNLLPGYKTYLVAIGAAVATLAALLNGDISIGDAINQWLIAGGAMTLRAGIKHDSSK